MGCVIVKERVYETIHIFGIDQQYTRTQSKVTLEIPRELTIMNDIVANTLSAYTSALDAATSMNSATRTTNSLVENSLPRVDHDLPLSLVVIKDANNNSIFLSPTTKRRGRVSPIPNAKLPLKKALSVRWKDQSNRENALHTDVSDDEILKVETEVDFHEMANPLTAKPKKRSPSPPYLDIKEYEQRMKKLKTSIGDACKLELKFLNQAKHVRDKRTRMVERLKHMKRKAQRFSVLNAQRGLNDSNSSEMDVVSTKLSDGNVITDNDDDDFVLPPVFHEKASKAQTSSNYIDMTQ
jgi:exonuclease VII large subunit